MTWKIDALKLLLEKRSLSKSVLYFSTNKMNIHLKTTSTKAIRHKAGDKTCITLDACKRMINTPEF